ncbi:MAG TPA: antibiotic biosynthesis monooxygenase [Hyphomicrobiaceae bacterium]|nr:antibiotic biosynthesis monooxygenase [Hyphomicrobiaceae bacterium]
MRWGLLALITLASWAGVPSAQVLAQAPAGPPPVPDGPRYVVTYLEVMPTQTAQAKKLVRQFRDATQREPGNLRAEALQRIGWPNQFVLLDAWKDPGSAEGHGKAATTGEFRDKIKAIQNAPLDERTHFPLSVASLPAKSGRSAVAAVTHVDVIPPQRENGTALTKQLAEDGRKDDGNLRFEAVVQTNRQNHFTVIELWRDRKAAEAHSMAAHTRAYREKLAPASGALYDERFYKALD